MNKKPPTEKQLAARAKFAEAARARAAAKKATKVEEPKAEAVDTDKNCIFCGKFTTWHRFVNLQSVAVCDEHYYSKSTGETVEKLREITHAL